MKTSRLLLLSFACFGLSALFCDAQEAPQPIRMDFSKPEDLKRLGTPKVDEGNQPLGILTLETDSSGRSYALIKKVSDQTWNVSVPLNLPGISPAFGPVFDLSYDYLIGDGTTEHFQATFWAGKPETEDSPKGIARAFHLHFDYENNLHLVTNGDTGGDEIIFQPGTATEPQWVNIRIRVDFAKQHYSIFADQKTVADKVAFTETISSIYTVNWESASETASLAIDNIVVENVTP